MGGADPFFAVIAHKIKPLSLERVDTIQS
jgi:hypothetical protein